MAVGLAWGRARGGGEVGRGPCRAIIFLAGESCFNQPAPCPIHLLGLVISLSFADGRYLAMSGRTADEHPCHQVTCNNALLLGTRY